MSFNHRCCSKFKSHSFICIVTLTLILPSTFVQCQFTPPSFGSPTQLAYGNLDNLTSALLSSKLVQDYSFCIRNKEREWNTAFNFSSDLSFLTACIAKTGDATRRFCTAAEAEIYFSNLKSGGDSLKLNRNCNSSHWVAGCEPGWACGLDNDDPVDLKNSRDIPPRGSDCDTCCEGFFCPQGLTCMLPCPLGSYCPLATFNVATGRCDPYKYKLPAATPNHTCGGANMWADARTNSEVFCSAGSYCPTSIEQLPCSDGNYCPKGSTDEKRCFRLTTCNSKSESQNIHAYGVMLIAALSTLLLIIYNCSDQIITTRERRYAKLREAAARTVKEKAQARARWKVAKEAAKKACP